MCDDDFLLTYNPECLERHSDSSDFEDNDPQRIGGGKYSILRRKLFRHTIMEIHEKNFKCKNYKKGYGKTDCVYENHAVHPRQCECKECVIPVEEKQIQTILKRKKVRYGHQGDSPLFQPTPSRLSVVRSKIMPCLSSIFGRSYHSKRDDSEKDKHVIINSTKDNYCQVYCVKCNHKRLTSKKLNNTIQTNYSTDDGLDIAPDSGINIDSLVGKKTATKDSSISCDFSSSSYSTNVEATKLKFRKIIEKEIKKAYLRRQRLNRKQEEQLPKMNFQVFSSTKSSKVQNLNLENDLKNKNNFGCNVMPSNSSVFWEYLVDRINKKYQNRDVTIKSCHCTNTQPLPSTTKPCPYMESLLSGTSSPKLEYKTNEQTTQEACSCKTSPNNLQNQIPAENQLQQDALQSGIKLNNAPLKPDKVQCQCYPDKPSKLKEKSPIASPPGSPGQVQEQEINRPCQEPHDQIKASLEKRYNGEVLCIHNPPCILINGCLNLPAVKTSPQQFGPSAWPVTQTASFHCGFQQTDIQNQTYEKCCQYQPPNGQYELTVYKPKSEKMTQSICHHNPPCEVVRCCYKPEFDPMLENSCVHVPMCEKVPKCVSDEKDKSLKCQHQPQCSDLPVCKTEPKRYIVMTEKDNACTQVKPNVKMECRHVPPCIMIPKCLGKLMCDGYIPHEAIPGCVHQPMCEMIPACCRKSARMSSFFRNFKKRRPSNETTV